MGGRLTRRRFLGQAAVGLGGAGIAFGRSRAFAGLAEEVILEQAREGVVRHRMGWGRLRVAGADGSALPGAVVQVDQLRHRFLFGCTAFGWKRGGVRSALDQAYLDRLAGLFNVATLGFYWHIFEPKRGEPRYAETDEVVAWCRGQGLVCKGHPLAWANIPQPEWLPEDGPGIREASLGRVREIVGRFRGQIDLWDVVNEPSLLLWATTRYGQWAQAIGTQAYVSQHLQAAREANPEATLLVNEVLTQYPVYPLLDSLRDASGRAFCDAVGIQGHMHLGPWSLRGIQGLCDRYARLGVPLHFPEVTVLSGERLEQGEWGPSCYEYEVMQGEYVPKLYTVLFGHPAVGAIGWWDLSDRGAWKGAAAGLLRADMSPKPAYERLDDLIRRQWWTRVRGETNGLGEFSFQAFYGRHRITVRGPGGQLLEQECDWAPGQANRIDITFPASKRS